MFVTNMITKRKRAGMTQASFAEALVRAGLRNMNQSTVSRIELMQRPVQLVEARTIADVLDTTVDDLIDPKQQEQLLIEAAMLWTSSHEHAQRAVKAISECHLDWDRAGSMLAELDRVYSDTEEEETLAAYRQVRDGLEAVRNLDLMKTLLDAWEGAPRGEHSTAS